MKDIFWGAIMGLLCFVAIFALITLAGTLFWLLQIPAWAIFVVAAITSTLWGAWVMWKERV